jgi:hypothetical protein
MSKYTYRVELDATPNLRIVDADSFTNTDQWIIFYRSNLEYWRVSLDRIISIETIRHPYQDSPNILGKIGVQEW